MFCTVPYKTPYNTHYISLKKSASIQTPTLFPGTVSGPVDTAVKEKKEKLPELLWQYEKQTGRSQDTDSRSCCSHSERTQQPQINPCFWNAVQQHSSHQSLTTQLRTGAALTSTNGVRWGSQPEGYLTRDNSFLEKQCRLIQVMSFRKMLQSNAD